MKQELQPREGRYYFRGDRQIWIIVFLLMLISVVEVYSTTFSLADPDREDSEVCYADACRLVFCLIVHVALCPRKEYSESLGGIIWEKCTTFGICKNPIDTLFGIYISEETKGIEEL